MNIPKIKIIEGQIVFHPKKQGGFVELGGGMTRGDWLPSAGPPSIFGYKMRGVHTVQYVHPLIFDRNQATSC